MRLPSTLSSRILKTSSDGDSITSLGRLLQCLIVLSVKNFFLMWTSPGVFRDDRQWPCTNGSHLSQYPRVDFLWAHGFMRVEPLQEAADQPFFHCWWGRHVYCCSYLILFSAVQLCWQRQRQRRY